MSKTPIRGQGKFEGVPCSKHPGNNLRYVCNHTCILCSYEVADLYRAAKKQEAVEKGVSINSLVRKGPRKSYYIPVALRGK